MSARDELGDAFTRLYNGSAGNTDPDQLMDARDAEVRREDAALIRKAKVREPIDDAERYVNAVLEDVAVKIEGAS
jgi:hypothetical protein